MVMGFVYIFSIYQLNTGNITTRAAGNFVDYYSRTVVHEIAVSGLNIAAANLYEDYSWRGPMQNIPFQGGSFDIVFGGTADTLKVYSISSYNEVTDTVIAFFTGQNSYTEYTLFTANENGVAWVAGDTVWGPIHTNGVLNHQNKSSIVFFGKASAGKTISSPPKNSKTQFLGGYEVGNFLPEVDNMNNLIIAAGSGGYTFPFVSDTMKLEFNSDGTLDLYRNSSKIYDDLSITSLTSNGAIYTAGPLVILGGEVNTNPNGVTIGSAGNIILKDEISYANNPETNPNSDDLLALVAGNNIVVDNTTKTDWKVQAVLMCINGSLAATVMNKNGTFDYYGSVYQMNRGSAQMFQSFQKKYKHDERLNDKTPPYYPGMNKLRLIAWWE